MRLNASAVTLPWILLALWMLLHQARLGLALGLVAMTPWLRSTRSEAVAMAVSLGAYFVGALAATELGNFPVPVLGAGAGHVLGWYSALVILRASMTPPARPLC